MTYASMKQYKQSAEEHYKRGDFSYAEKFFQSALEEAQTYEPANEYTIQHLKTMGIFYLSLGAYAKSEPFLLKSLEIEKNLLKPDQIALARTHNLLGVLYHLWGHHAQAENQYRQAIRIEEKAPYGRYPQYDTGLSHQSHYLLAMALCAQGRRSEAFQLCSQSCGRMIKNMGPNGRTLCADLHALATQYCARNQQAEADKIAQWVLEISSEQMQKEYLGCTLREALQNRLESAGAIWFSSQYESVISEDEMWRPSAIYRHADLEKAFLPAESTTVVNRLAAETEDAWRPSPRFSVKRN